MKTTIDMAREAGADTLMYWDIEKLKRFEALVLANKRAAPVQEPVAWTDEQLQMLNFLYGTGEWDGLWFDQKHPAKKGAFWWRSDLRRLFTTPPAAQPAVPDAITDSGENPEYRAGWNECRETMLQMKARTL
jgi:hypothetical protein